MTMIFDEQARADFAAHYPETPHRLTHHLGDHPLLTLEALAQLGAALPDASVEYNKADLPLGVAPDAVEANGLSIADTIRTVAENQSWAVLKNIEQMPEYHALLLSLLEELRPVIEARTGRMLRPQGFIFVSSPHAVTPYHFDPEHNILLQLVGDKVMTQFPVSDGDLLPATAHEAYHTGGHRNLIWRDDYAARGTAYPLAPGDALFVPVMAPHHVRVGEKVSISLSITWRSDWSFAEADAHAFNAVLRRAGLSPRAPGRFPHQNRVKATAWRLLRKAGLDRWLRAS